MRETTQKTLLVAEDCWITRQVLKLLLRKEFKVVEAENGQQAIEVLKARKRRIACLFLGSRLPTVAGYGVMDYMRQSGLNSLIPVIAVTSAGDSAARARCLRGGMVDFIEKPIHLPSLMDKVHRALAQFAPAGDGSSRQVPELRTEGKSASRRGKVAAYCRSTSRLLEAQLVKTDFRAVRGIAQDIREFATEVGAQDLADASTVLDSVVRAKDTVATAAAIRNLIAHCHEYRGSGR